MKLSQALRMLREASGQSVRTFAAEIGLDHSTYWRIEQGKPCDLAALGKLLSWLISTDTGEKGGR